MAKPVKGHSSRYSAYTGGPDPLAPPVDLREALEQIGQDVMGGTSPRRALSELLRRATADTASRALGGIDVGPLVSAVEGGSAVTTGERVSAKDVLAALPDLPVIEAIAKRLGADSEGERAAALELALEALYLAKRIDKASGEGETVYG